MGGIVLPITKTSKIKRGGTPRPWVDSDVDVYKLWDLKMIVLGGWFHSENTCMLPGNTGNYFYQATAYSPSTM
jgi:hypothetical protein